jgi:multidrug efflux pump subunit AcrB
MKGLINLFVRRPVTVIMLLAAMIIASVFSLLSLPVNRLPDFSVPRVTVETIYPGMAAGDIRSLVTIPLEDSLSPVKGLEKIRSVSRDNRSFISMDFRWGTDPMAASVLVREAIDAVYPSLPEGVRKPAVTSGDAASEPHAIIAVRSRNANSQTAQAAARKLAEYELRARFRRIEGSGSVILAGGETMEERLSLDTARLAALGLSPQEFAGLLMQETADIPAGNAREGNRELVIISSGKPENVSSLSKVILPVANGTFAVEDAGQLFSAPARRESVFVFNGKEAVALEIYRRPGSDPLRLSREIRKTLDEAAFLFSRDFQIELAADSGPSLVRGITGLVISASLGAAAVFAVILIFIRRLKYSLLASLSIPVSVAAGICVLAAAGKSLNSMSLGGLAMGIGLVSDISVIVLDLLHRAFGKSPSVPEPRQIGDKAFSIAGSSIASTLTTALVFAPIVMLPGPLGSLFGDIAVSLVTAVAAGWFYAQFCLPSLYRFFYGTKAAFIYKTVSSSKAVLTDGSFEKKYSRFLLLLLRSPEKIFAFALLFVCIGILSIITRPFVFINPDEAEEIMVSILSPPGTLLETAVGRGLELSGLLSGLPSVKTVYGRAGAEEEDTGRRADIDYIKEEFILRCVLEKGVKPAAALAQIKAAASYAAVYFPKDRTEVLLGLSAQRTFVIKGNDREELNERLKTARDSFGEVFKSAVFRPQGQRPELRFYPNREAAAYLSLPASQIAETLYVINEGITAARLEIEGRPVDVRVTGGNTSTYLENIQLRTPQGKNVYLGSLGAIQRKEAEASLARLDRSDVIYADFVSDKKTLENVKKIAARFSWFQGADESAFSRYKSSLFIYVILVLILLYMAMGAQFESFLLPLILMMTIPFSLAGAGPALILSGSKIDSGAVLGLTALFGLVVNNSLVLYEISDQKIKSGLSPAAAVFCGANERLRAIVITAATTVFALLPLVLSPLGNSQKSMAAAMLGGLAASTLLSLFAIPPVLISFFKWKTQNGERK